MNRVVVSSTKLSGILQRQCARLSLHTQNQRYFSDESNRNNNTEQEPVKEQDTKKLSGFAKSYETLTTLSENINKPVKDTATFKELLRNSNFIDVSYLSHRRANFKWSHLECHYMIGCLLSFFCLFNLAGWSTPKSSWRSNLSCGQRRFIHWFRLEIPLCMPKTNETRTVSFQFSLFLVSFEHWNSRDNVDCFSLLVQLIRARC